jgi:AraC-like DNA-binding protein
MAYLRERRIGLARSMLAAGDASVEEVANAVGFSDPFHVSRAFRRKTGMSPSAYRASLKSPFQR